MSAATAEAEAARTAPDRDLALVAEVVRQVEKRAARPLDAKARRRLIEDMVNGGLARLDPYSGFMNARQWREFQKHSRGRFGGIGVQVVSDPRTGWIQVISPMVGTPAYEAGIQAGDFIVKVEGRPVENMTLDDAVDRITGKVGEPVTLSVWHLDESKPVEMKLTRAVIEVESVLGDLRKPDNLRDWDFMYDKKRQIAYVRLASFGEKTADDLRLALAVLRRQGMRGLVLDLRYNPGGLLESAWRVSNLFLDAGKKIVSVRYRDRDEEVLRAEEEWTLLPSVRELPVAVLINRGSASASEIVALALQDHKRAVVVGERSFGKGCVQSLIKTEDETTRLKLTTASYFSPHGRSIHRFPGSKDTDNWGVKPDKGFAVKLDEKERRAYFAYRAKRDVVSRKKARAGKTDKSEDKTPPFVDRVLEKALEHLRAEIGKHGSKKAA
jgi:carboxyl-terminal processing protease